MNEWQRRIRFCPAKTASCSSWCISKRQWADAPCLCLFGTRSWNCLSSVLWFDWHGLCRERASTMSGQWICRWELCFLSYQKRTCRRNREPHYWGHNITIPSFSKQTCPLGGILYLSYKPLLESCLEFLWSICIKKWESKKYIVSYIHLENLMLWFYLLEKSIFPLIF